MGIDIAPFRASRRSLRERNSCARARSGPEIMAESLKILVAEDDDATRSAWTELIESWGYRMAAAEDGAQAVAMVDSFNPQILLLDLKLPHMDGLEVLSALRERGAQITTIVISGEGEIPDAVRAIKLGAYDYLRKPVDLQHLRVMLQNLTERIRIAEENRRLRLDLIQSGKLGPLIGESAAMRRVLSVIEQAAPSNASVLIIGESGCGKEVVARTIHELSPRSAGPYIAINCAALPETLMESELFGHERGAFTGADRRREGCFELANGGTLLLDEIVEMKVELQAKLLRVLEDQTVRRVGGSAEIPLNVRVLAASNRDLEAAIRENRLRHDLYYRLNVFRIEVPPLRKRVEDLPALADHFVREFARENQKDIGGIDQECMEALRKYQWPGNVRELRNVIERAVVVAEGPLLRVGDLSGEISHRPAPQGAVELKVGKSLDEVERELILKTLDTVGGNKPRAAEILGISLKTLYNRLEKYRAQRNP
jgi:DNA-binding NtrC family response regulator